jgi:hypothetical protein
MQSVMKRKRGPSSRVLISIKPGKYPKLCMPTDLRCAEACRSSRSAPSFRCAEAWNLTDPFYGRTAGRSGRRAFGSEIRRVVFGAGSAHREGAPLVSHIWDNKSLHRPSRSDERSPARRPSSRLQFSPARISFYPARKRYQPRRLRQL